MSDTMGDAVVLFIVSIFILIIVAAMGGDIKTATIVLFVVNFIANLALAVGWRTTEGMASSPEEMKESNHYETDYSYDPIAEMHAAELPNDDNPNESNRLYDLASGPYDFDDYGSKGYIPGYSDVYLYNKDGSDVFSDLYRGATEEGTLRWGQDKPEPGIYDAYMGDGDPFGYEYDNDPLLNKMMRGVGGRADNHSAQLHSKMQKRSKENIINSVNNNRRAWEKWYGKELDENEEKREWWTQDQLYNPIQRLT